MKKQMKKEMRLVDANALLEDFGEEPMVWNDGEAEIQERSDWHKYRVLVELQPTVDAVKVVHGKWKNEGGRIKMDLRCSVCNKRASNFVGGYEDWWDLWMPNYCPNCGAKMDGGNEK